MKKNLKTIALAAFAAISIMGVGTSLLNASSQKNILDVTLREVESMADNELPEVVIECGKVTGRCWDGDCEPFYTPFGPNKAWDCYIFTGYIYDICVDEAPCW